MEDLRGKSVLITGAAVRVGRAMAKAVAKAGATVLIHYGRSEKEGRDLQAELEATGVQSHLLPADLSIPDQAVNLMARAWEFSPVYGLVNSAAAFQDLTLDTTNLTDWEYHLKVNLTAPFLLSQAYWKRGCCCRP